ncbi:hypothetical protein KAU55_00635 [Candidatus Bathyarchaeota archaeon]|nr:hypothetical protein [Candidatus Bathyarchaeota archaeon]
MYDGFLKFHGLAWEKPQYKITRKLPFIPLEKELDALIASTGKTISAILQILKETGMRIGEALSLEYRRFTSESELTQPNSMIN